MSATSGGVVRAGEIARRVGVTVRACVLRVDAYPVVSPRTANGYRSHGPHEIRLIGEIKMLIGLGLTADETRPFLDCLSSGHAAGHACPAALATYRQVIRKPSHHIEQLTRKRDVLQAHLEAAVRSKAGGGSSTHAAARSAAVVEHAEPAQADPYHDLVASCGSRLPGLALTTSSADVIWLDAVGEGRSLRYAYPLTGRPGVDLPESWDSIPGRPRLHRRSLRLPRPLRRVGRGRRAPRVRLSSRSSYYQREFVDRLRLPFAMLSDEQFAVAKAIGLPTSRRRRPCYWAGLPRSGLLRRCWPAGTLAAVQPLRLPVPFVMVGSR